MEAIIGPPSTPKAKLLSTQQDKRPLHVHSDIFFKEIEIADRTDLSKCRKLRDRNAK